MKKTDIAMIILIASVSVLLAFFITRAIFGDSANEPVTVQTIEKINTDIGEVNPDVFSESAINPAVEVQLTPGTQ